VRSREGELEVYAPVEAELLLYYSVGPRGEPLGVELYKAGVELPTYGLYIERGRSFYLLEVDGRRYRLPIGEEPAPAEAIAEPVTCEDPRTCPVEFWGLIRREDYIPALMRRSEGEPVAYSSSGHLFALKPGEVAVKPLLEALEVPYLFSQKYEPGNRAFEFSVHKRNLRLAKGLVILRAEGYTKSSLIEEPEERDYLNAYYVDEKGVVELEVWQVRFNVYRFAVLEHMYEVNMRKLYRLGRVYRL
jgi:hypothetical protein